MIIKDVISIGSTTRDTFFEVDLPITKWPSAPLGKALVIPFGEKFGVKGAYFTIGGNAANASVTFARQGLRVGLFTKIGNDVAGQEVIKILKRERVDTRLVSKSKELPTSYSVLLSQKGDRSILTYHGAIGEFTLEKVNPKLLKSKWWYVSLPGDSHKALSGILKYAKKRKIKVALNPSYKHLSGDGKSQLLTHLKDLSFLVVNEGEAAQITGIPFSKEKEVFQKLDVLVPGIVAITSGRGGVTVSDGKFLYKAGIFKEKRVVDRTGAGDAFGSGFVAGLIRKKEKFKGGRPKPENVEYAIRLASANATSVVERMGATEGVLRRRDFDSLPRFKKLKIERREFKPKKK